MVTDFAIITPKWTIRHGTYDFYNLTHFPLDKYGYVDDLM